MDNSDKERDAILKRMLETPPEPHKAKKKKGKAKKRKKKGTRAASAQSA